MFRASEVFNFAIAIEKKGRTFYRAMAAAAKDDRARQLFQRLAQEEEQHVLDFARLAEGVGSYDPPESYPGEYDAYMEALVNSHVFSRDLDPEALAEEILSDKEALDLAIRFEKDSLLFFAGLRNLVSQTEVRFIDELLRQERRHLCELHSLLNA
ncbi:MAG TPA: rubrerythrin [Peptococcaceae bacterium]|nr:rubrerythrin [Peptococcaceae bacterium]